MSNKKELLARVINGNTQCIGLYYEGGGELPKILSGMYTSKTEAMKAADLYLRGRDMDNKTEVKDA